MPERDEILQSYADGKVGTRTVMARLGFHDYADLIIALAQHDLAPPRPADTPMRQAHLARARAILMPRLVHAR